MPPENTLGRLQYSLKLAFYNRATLCVSAVLLSPGVCPTVTFVHSVHTAEDIVKLLCRPGSRIILDFLILSAATQLQGEPLQQGAQSTRSVGKFCDFRLKSPSILETVRDRPIFAMER